MGLSLLGLALEQRPGGVWTGCCGCRVLQRIFVVVLGELVLSLQREQITTLPQERCRHLHVDISFVSRLRRISSHPPLSVVDLLDLHPHVVMDFLHSSKMLLSPLWKLMLLRARSCLLKLHLYSVKRSAAGSRLSGGKQWLASVTLSRHQRRNAQYTGLMLKDEVFM